MHDAGTRQMCLKEYQKKIMVRQFGEIGMHPWDSMQMLAKDIDDGSL